MFLMKTLGLQDFFSPYTASC